MFGWLERMIRWRSRQLWDVGREQGGTQDVDIIHIHTIEGRLQYVIAAERFCGTTSEREIISQYEALFHEPRNPLFLFWFKNGNFFYLKNV